MRMRVLVARMVWDIAYRVPMKYRARFLLKARAVVQAAIRWGVL
jgi:hypothetical protein